MCNIFMSIKFIIYLILFILLLRCANSSNTDTNTVINCNNKTQCNRNVNNIQNKENSERFQKVSKPLLKVYNNFQKSTIKQLKSIQNVTLSLSDITKKITENLKPIELKLKQTAFEFLLSLNISVECQKSVLHVWNGLRNGQLWAYKLFDANGKLPSGVLEGVSTIFGNYEQCLDIKSAPIYDNNEYIYGKYCLIRPYVQIIDFKQLETRIKKLISDIQLSVISDKEIENNINIFKVLVSLNVVSNKFYVFNYGLCIPSMCSVNDVQNILKNVIQPIINIPIEVGPKCDVSTDNLTLNNYQTVMLILMSIMVAFSLISTILMVYYQLNYNNNNNYDIIINNNYCSSLRPNKPNVWIDYLKQYSLIDANKQLFSPLTNRLLAADALQLLYSFWLLAVMNYTSIIGSGFVGYRNVHNSYLLNIVNETKYFWLRTLFHKDMILVISGIYISYDFFGDKQIPLTVWQYIRFVGEKWYRLTVKMLASLLVFNLLSLIGSGPLWNTGYPTFVESCSQNYWANLLFISNLIHESSQLCNPGTWFILLIFQLHIISPLFLVPFKISPHFGYIFNLIAFLLTCVVNILQKLLLNLKAMPYEAAEVHTAIEMRQSIMRLFGFPDQYISIFIVGIVFGYIMRNKNQLDNLVKNIHVKFVNSIICYSLFIAVIAWSENFKDMNVIQNKYNFNLWFTFGKVFWTIANLWLMYDVLSKDMFQVLLSSSLFGVILRLSYGILLIGPIVIGYRKLTLRDTVPLRHSAQIEHLIMDIALMIVISYLMYIFIEYPLIKLLNIFKNKKLDKKQNNLIVKSTQTAIDENANSIELKYIFIE